MAIFTGFYKASYSISGKRVYFYARVCREPAIGRKTIIHEYPQSDTRYVQDNGKISGIYVLEVEIQEDTSSAYKRAVKKIRDALEVSGIGTLTHPELGKKKVVPTNNSRLANIISEDGISRFTLTFHESDENKYPTQNDSNIGKIGQLYDTIFGDNESFLGSTVENVTSFVETFNDFRDNVQEVTSTISDAVATINGVADEVSAFTRDITDLTASINELVQTPTNLALRLSNIWGAISEITDNFSDMFDLSLNIYGTGNGRTTSPINSPITNTITTNNQALYDFNNVSALSLAYTCSTSITYDSQEDVDEILSRLNTAFYALDPDTVDEDIYYNLQDLRTQNRLYLENLKLGLPYLHKIRVNSIPSSILAYNLYEDSTRSSEIIDINSIEDPAFVSGNINVLSE